MKAAEIARVSDLLQDSNEAQMSRMHEYVKRNDKLKPWKTYQIKESSSRGERTQFMAILKEIVKEAEATKETIAVVFETIDRLQRSFKEMLLLEELVKDGKIELHFYRENLVIHKNSNSSEITRWEIGVLLAHAYILQLSDNVKRKFEQMRREGKWTGRPRIGYKNIQILDEQGNVIEKNIVEDSCGHLVSKMFELFLTGQYSITGIWLKMRELGLRGRTGLLSRSDVALMLKDPFFYGMALSKKHGLYTHKYPRLTDEPTWKKCQDILAGRRKRRNKEESKPYALKGLVVCAKCDCLYSPETHKGHIYYSCTNGKHTCKRVYMTEAELLKPLYKLFADFEKIPQKVQDKLVEELRSLNEGESVFHEREVARIRTEYDRIQRRKDVLLDALLDQSITKPDYDRKLQELNDTQNRLNIELEEHTKGDHEYHIHVGTVFSLSRRMGSIFKDSEPAEKKAILQFLLQNATANGKKLEYKLKKPFDTVLSYAHHPTVRRG